MSIWAIVPVKPFRESKSRLSGVLTPDERETLSRTFLIDTLDILRQVREVQRTLVISRDSTVLRVARERQAHTVTESGAPELNEALARATDVAGRLGANAVLVLPSDMPMLEPSDVSALIKLGGAPRCVVIAPDWRKQGTNALFMRPPRLIPYAYGPGSFNRHVALARERDIQIEVCELPGFEIDVDLPQDLELFRARLQNWKGR